jgi:hypothetical protein
VGTAKTTQSSPALNCVAPIHTTQAKRTFLLHVQSTHIDAIASIELNHLRTRSVSHHPWSYGFWDIEFRRKKAPLLASICAFRARVLEFGEMKETYELGSLFSGVRS